MWFVEPDLNGFTVHALLGPEQEEPAEVHADAVLLATGGYEKVLPFPGWTLPGVVTAGGAQAMLKGGLVLPGRTAVVAGTGPLLLPVATGLAAAGAEVAALVESADPKAFLRRGGRFAAYPAKIAEGAQYAAELLRHRVKTFVHHTVVEAHGGDRLDAVTVAALDADGRVRPGTERRIPCDTLAIGHGMLPHTDLAEALGCRIDGLDVHVDDEQRTDVPGVWAAGETTGIGGAALSLAEGHIAGRSIAARLSGAEPDPRGWAAAARTRTKLRKFFAAVDSAYAPRALDRADHRRHGRLPLRGGHRRCDPRGRRRTRRGRCPHGEAAGPGRYGLVPGPGVRSRCRGARRMRTHAVAAAVRSARTARRAGPRGESEEP